MARSSFVLFCILVISLCRSQTMVRFIATGDDSGGSITSLYYSLDGISWSGVTGIFTFRGNNAAYSLSLKRWIASGSGANTLAWSDDGISWNGLGFIPFSTEGNGIHYSEQQNRWTATGSGTNTLATSIDGKIWIALGSTIFTTRGQDVVYAPALNLWVSVGEGTNTIATSLDGITWTGLGLVIFTTPVTTKPISISYSSSTSLGPNGQFQVVGISSSNTQAFSPDGVTWTGTGQSGLGTNTVRDVVYAQGKWVITGPTLATPTPFGTSTTGTSWTVGPTMTGLLTGGRGITYSSDLNLWVAVGSGTNTSFIYSNDGVSWVKGSPNGFSVTGYGVASGGYTITLVPLPTQITNLQVNSSIVYLGEQTAVSGNLEVIGDLNLDGQLILNSSAIVNVSGTFTANGTLSLVVGGEVSCTQAKILSNSSLEIIIPSTVNITVPGTQINVTVLSYLRLFGVYDLSSIQVISSTLSTSVCTSNQPSYSSSSLSVLITVTSCSGGGSGIGGGGSGGGGSIGGGETVVVGSSASSNLGLIIGVVVGVVIVGIALGIMVWFLTRTQIRKRQAVASQAIRDKAIENLSRQIKPTVLL